MILLRLQEMFPVSLPCLCTQKEMNEGLSAALGSTSCVLDCPYDGQEIWEMA